jgi:glycosyltransferase involved in cell wall biosynthesis
MRILAVGNMYPPHHLGGYELMWQAAMDAARAAGHELRIVASVHRERGVDGEVDPDVHRTLRWYWDWHAYEFPSLSLRERVQLERRNRAELRRHLREFRPDVVAWWAMGSMSLSLIEQVRLAGVPAVFCVHDDWLVYAWEADRWTRIWRGWRRRVAPLAERVVGVPTSVDVLAAGPLVFNSEYTRRRAAEAGFPAADATVVYPGVDQSYLDPLPEQPWGWRLLYAGRIDRHKGVDTAIAALAELPGQATLAIYGTGDEAYTAELRELATSLDLADRVRFEGFADAERLRGAYAGADAVLFPVRWDEPFGLVPLEAMGLGRPVVATSRGGATEFLRDGENALVFQADDHAALADRVRSLAADPGLRGRLRAGGVQTAGEYTLDRFAERTVAAIERAAQVGS